MAIISTLVCTTAGYLYPVYRSYKILMYNPNEASKILVYWIVIGTFAACQVLTDKILFWFPFYSEIKAIFILWLTLPATNGYQVIFNRFIISFFNKYEKQIDSGYDTILYLLKNKFIEVNQKLWVIIQEKIFNIEIKAIKTEEKKPTPNRIQQIEPIMKTKLNDDTPLNPAPVNHVNPVVKRVASISHEGSSPAHQRKAVVMPMSPSLANKNVEIHKKPLSRQSSVTRNEIQNHNSNNNSNNNTPLMKNYKKTVTPLPSIKNNNEHISDKYQKIKLYKEQLLDVLSQLEKDEEKEIRLYNKNNSKMPNSKDKSSHTSNVLTINNNTNLNINSNMINSKLSKNNKDPNYTDFDYNFNESDYEAILNDSKSFVKNSNKGHGSSITNFLKNFKSR